MATSTGLEEGVKEKGWRERGEEGGGGGGGEGGACLVSVGSHGKDM